MVKIENKKFLKLLLALVIPMAFQQLIATTLNLADTVMVSSLGEEAIAAVGLVNQFFYFYMITIFGVSSSAQVFLAQYFGKGDKENMNKYFFILLSLVTTIGLIFTGISFFKEDFLVKFLTPDPGVQGQIVEYLRVIRYILIVHGLSIAITTGLRNTKDARSPLYVSILAFFINIIFNYLFIFGKYSFPRLGVRGAAMGTLIARLVELIILLIVLVFRNKYLELKPAIAKKIKKENIKAYVKVGFPIIAAETFWSLSQLIFSISYARIGKEASAAIQLSGTIQNFFYIMINSLSAAAAIIMGQSLGKGKIEETEAYSKRFLLFALISATISATILLTCPNYLLMLFYGIDENLRKLAANLIMIRATFITFAFLNQMLVVGVFRSGGDTKKPLIYELCTIWIYAVPVALVFAYHMKLRIEIVFAMVLFEEFIKFFIMYRRYKKKIWLRNITN